ncbi:MAG: putative porin [Candidatus Omnitrophota bacterium]|jgi:hypothetical protein
MQVMRKVFLIVSFVSISILIADVTFGGEIDILVEKLVEKGVLTHGEAQQILTETKEEMRTKMAAGELDTLPKWIQQIKPKGDIRVRFQNEDRTNAVDRNRGRVRFRWGLTAKPTDSLEATFRIASGSAEQTSTNQSFEEAFQTKYLWLDQAYATWTPFAKHDLKLIGGKMANPFYKKGDVMWDGDITPEGVAFNYTLPLEKTTGIEGMETFLTAGFFPIGDEESTSDPGQDEATLVGTQLGLGWNLPNKGKVKMALAYYDFHNVKGKNLSGEISDVYNPDTNTQDGSGNLIYDYNIINYHAETTLPWKLNVLGAELPVSLYTEIANNIADNVSKDSAYLFGVKLGKAKEKGSWELGYNYREIEDDAVMDIFGDSDFHGGGTNGKGHKLGWKYAFTDKSTFGVTYFNTKQENGSKDHHDTLQIDWVTKF